MLEITIPETEYFDDENQSFITMHEQKLRLEHSLVSIAKWESKWHKPFLRRHAHTWEETIDYVRCMTITQNVPNDIYYGLTDKNIKEIERYMDDKMTATWFRDNGRKNSREIITAEIIYYWMIEAGVPFECEKWHFNRLMTLIRVCSEKQSGGKKMSKNETLKQYAALNAARRKKFNSKG